MKLKKVKRNCLAARTICGSLFKVAGKAAVLLGAIGLGLSLIVDNIDQAEKRKKIKEYNSKFE